MGTMYCLICENKLPEGRRMTCSHECYVQLKFHKEEFKRDIEKKPDDMEALKIGVKRTQWQRELSRYQSQAIRTSEARECDLCGKPFIPRGSNQYCCSPTCQNLKAKGYTVKDL